MTLLVLGVVMGVFMTVVSSLQMATARQQGRVERNDDARLALAQLDREIRSGNVLSDPSLESNVSDDVVPNMSLRIYTQADAPNRNPGNQCAQWRITKGTIQTRRWAKGNFNTTVTPWWTVASNIVNRTVSPPIPAFTRDSTLLYARRMIRIRLVVDRPDDAAKPEEFDMSITGRNTDQKGIAQDICALPVS